MSGVTRLGIGPLDPERVWSACSISRTIDVCDPDFVPIRAAVMGLSQLYADVLHGAFDEPPELMLVAVDTTPLAGDVARLAAFAEQARPDALLAGLDGPDDETAIGDFAAGHSDIAVVAIATDCSRAWLVELEPALVPLGEVSPNGLRACVRAAVENRR